ncbi:hypothetical protein KAR91_60875 [Candidatus Pacearchaeota archaeon]|nr:hypothetical protein [Candidatus Pacearchaeota archaeon]
MAASIEQIIGAINPKLYSKLPDSKSKTKKKISEIKKISKEKGFLEAAKDIDPKSDADFTLTYETYAESLEPIYFWILDFMTEMNLTVEKYVDNFMTAPGSNQFVDFAQKKGLTQDRVTKIMGDINMVLRSVLNLIYDLKEFKIRLESYSHYKSDDKAIKKSALLSLKQLWMDKVDMNKGNSSLKAMALSQAGFQTLLDAFLAADTLKDAESLDLNERVKRILLPRIQEFDMWVIESEKELRKRYALEKNYLKSQVNSLKLYTHWAKPYLKVLHRLDAEDDLTDPNMVTGFNRTMLNLTLMATAETKASDDFPDDLKRKKEGGKLKMRKYSHCILVDFTFRTVPGQGVYMGKVDVKFKAYVLNEDELKVLKQEFENAGVREMLDLIEGATGESLEELQKEINSFLEEKSEDEEKEKEKKKKDESSRASNPFLAIIGMGEEKSEKKKEEKKKEEKIMSIEGDNWAEGKFIRGPGRESVKGRHFAIFDIYKKAHGMGSYPRDYYK